MIIESMELQNFRNYEQLHMEFDRGTNIFYGNNAQGKTNILEAVYLCCTSKSHRGSRDREMIRFREEESHIKLNVRKNDVPYRIDMHLKKNRAKGIAVNGIPIRRVSELFGIVNVVFFSPEDLNLIKNGPAERRKFIDVELCQLNKLYVHSLVSYNRVLTQRNKLLKDLFFHPEYEETLDVWDMQLFTYGKEVIRYRREFIVRLNEIIGPVHRKLSAGKEELSIVYDPNSNEEDLEKNIKNSRMADLKNKTTMTGPHRDDIGFYVCQNHLHHEKISPSAGEAIDIRKFGSQGQQRTAALSLKLAEIEMVRILVCDYPILLLDDVLSELDGERQKELLSAIDHIQTMITCTGLEDLINNRFQIDRLFHVVNGTVSCKEEDTT
ncbi:MAG: DNA replication/repair protein RecF [Clostridiales bacterium]|nr:DNA replication/repair protein RecF [Clostridiales bacterium]